MEVNKTASANQLNSSAQVFASGMVHMLQPVVVEVDTRMQAVFQSQNDLSAQIDQLTKGNRL